MATKQDVKEAETNIMSKITEFAEAVQESYDVIQTGLDGIQSDVTGLKTKIEELQNSLGDNITPESQALLDEVLVKVTNVANRITELDAQTPSVE